MLSTCSVNTQIVTIPELLVMGQEKVESSNMIVICVLGTKIRSSEAGMKASRIHSLRELRPVVDFELASSEVDGCRTRR